MSRVPIHTPVGVLRGRDCVYLDHAEFRDRMQTLVLAGDLNATLCEGAASEDDIPYVLSFSGVLAVRVLELDSWEDRPASSFDEIVDSPWLAGLGGKVGPEHRHFAFQTYDTVFDVICVTMTFETKPRGAAARL